MPAQSRHYHVALVDLLPADVEILNPDLAVREIEEFTITLCVIRATTAGQFVTVR
jgi:hypothetical protein